MTTARYDEMLLVSVKLSSTSAQPTIFIGPGRIVPLPPFLHARLSLAFGDANGSKLNATRGAFGAVRTLQVSQRLRLLLLMRPTRSFTLPWEEVECGKIVKTPKVCSQTP